LAYGGLSNTTTFKEASRKYLRIRYQGEIPPRSHEGRIEYWENIFGDELLINITKRNIVSGLHVLPDKLSNSTINKYKGAASVVFSYACRELELPENPARYVSSLKEGGGRTRFLSSDERGRLFKVCRSSKWEKMYLIALMAITTGARKGELMSLEWSDIDLDRQTAFVKTSKNGEPKVLPLTDSVIRELQLFKTKDSSLIFASLIKPDKPYCFTKPWYRALKDADIEDFRFHDLRHSCASYLAMNGASLLEIADVLGHKQIQMTKRYSHLCIEHKAKLINRVMSNM
jgi:integrase